MITFPKVESDHPIELYQVRERVFNEVDYA